ncbi:myb-related transcription factor, partner of profilin-like [Ambystoma mexicanum]|uniref:myb-related transcription factor, partner of profilin-like n=1 Tax=Ambystoma mexicanum TaxID=8296 RepID=UPI0037E73486
MTGRKKKSKFNNQELEVLIEEITKRVPQLVDPLHPKSILAEKSAVWEEIVCKVNEVATTERSVDDLKKKWQDLSQRVRDKLKEIKEHKARMGIGPPADMELTPLQEKVKNILILANVEEIDTGAGEGMPSKPNSEKSTEEESQTGAVLQTTDDVQRGSHSRVSQPELMKTGAAGPMNSKCLQIQHAQHVIQEDQILQVDHGQQKEDLSPSSLPPAPSTPQADMGAERQEREFLENYTRQLDRLAEYNRYIAQHCQLFTRKNDLHNQLIAALAQHLNVTKDLNETITRFALENQNICRALVRAQNIPPPNWQTVASLLERQNYVSSVQEPRCSAGASTCDTPSLTHPASAGASIGRWKGPRTRSQLPEDDTVTFPQDKKRK